MKKDSKKVKNSTELTKNMTQQLTKLQNELLKVLENTKDLPMTLKEFNIDEEQLKFWRKTNLTFNDTFLKKLGITVAQERFLYVFPRKLLNVASTCREVGIHRSTYYNWMNKSDTFRSFVHIIEEELYDNIETLIYKKALEGNVKMLIFIAKTKMKDRGYGDTIIIQNTNQNNYQDMPLKEIEEEIRKLEEKYR